MTRLSHLPPVRELAVYALTCAERSDLSLSSDLVDESKDTKVGLLEVRLPTKSKGDPMVFWSCFSCLIKRSMTTDNSVLGSEGCFPMLRGFRTREAGDVDETAVLRRTSLCLIFEA